MEEISIDPNPMVCMHHIYHRVSKFRALHEKARVVISPSHQTQLITHTHAHINTHTFTHPHNNYITSSHISEQEVVASSSTFNRGGECNVVASPLVICKASKVPYMHPATGLGQVLLFKRSRNITSGSKAFVDYLTLDQHLQHP